VNFLNCYCEHLLMSQPPTNNVPDIEDWQPAVRPGFATKGRPVRLIVVDRVTADKMIFTPDPRGSPDYVPPAPKLVNVEENPGPVDSWWDDNAINRINRAAVDYGYVRGERAHVHPPVKWASRVANTLFSPLTYLVPGWVEREAYNRFYDEAADRKERLVGIEPNPGPKAGVKVVKKVTTVKRGRRQKKVGQRLPPPPTNVVAMAPPMRQRRQARARQPPSGRESYIMEPVRQSRAFQQLRPIKGYNGMQAQAFTARGIPVSGVTAVDSKTGGFIYTVKISPTTLGIKYANNIGLMFQRYWIRRVSFKLNTGLGMNEAGAVVGFFNSEPSDDINLVPQAARYDNAIRRPGAKTYNVWHQNMTWTMPRIMTSAMTRDGKVMNELFYVDSYPGQYEQRLTTQGTFSLIVANTLGTNAAASGGLGNLEVDVDMELFMQQDDNITPVPVSVATLEVDGGGSLSNTAPLGTAPNNIFNTSPLAITYRADTGNDYLTGFPTTYDSYWLMSYYVNGTVLASGILNLTGVGVTVTNISESHSLNAASTGCTGYRFFKLSNVISNSPYCIFTFSSTTVTSSRVIVTSASSNMQVYRGQYAEVLKELDLVKSQLATFKKDGVVIEDITRSGIGGFRDEEKGAAAQDTVQDLLRSPPRARSVSRNRGQRD
jgi:hypothetical protein